jgi:hypothetical protein
LLLPKWEDPERLKLMQAIKITNFRMKHKNSDNIKVKCLMEESKNADTSIIKNKKYIIETGYKGNQI